MNLEPLENCLICWIPTPKAPHLERNIISPDNQTATIVDVTVPFEGEEDSLTKARESKEDKYSSWLLAEKGYQEVTIDAFVVIQHCSILFSLLVDWALLGLGFSKDGTDTLSGVSPVEALEPLGLLYSAMVSSQSVVGLAAGWLGLVVEKL